MKMRLKIILVCIGVATLIKTQAQAELDYNESSSMQLSSKHWPKHLRIITT